MDIALAVPDKTVIWAKQQTAARGRRGRAWHAPLGNLYCSLVLKPGKPLLECSQLGYVAALAIFDTAGELCDDQSSIACKWPNDVLIDGEKASGILLETVPSDTQVPHAIVLGIGINVANHPDDTPYPATSLVNHGACDITVEQTLERFIHHFDHWLNIWVSDGFSQLRKIWLTRVAGLEKKIIVRLENNELSGIFKGIDETGALMLLEDDMNENSIIHAGDIFFPDLIP